ncbi:MAG: YraN family protein [Candidatus Babeliaceae bacterium]
MTNYRDLGKRGEILVSRTLEKQQFTIKALNFMHKGGEIDIIAQRKNLMIFVEVKLRRHLYFALSEIITPSKQKKIIQTACCYKSIHGLTDMILRFDVAFLTLQGTEYEITYIPDAFRPSEAFFI